MATSSAVYGLPIPTGGETPDMPKAMATYTTKLESVLGAEFAKTVQFRGVLPANTDVTTLPVGGSYGSSGAWGGRGVTGMPSNAAADTAGRLEVLPFISNLKMMTWTTMGTVASKPPRTWVRFQTYSGWGDWVEPTPKQNVTSVASLTGAIGAAALVDALGSALNTKIETAVSAAAIEAAEGDLDVFDVRYVRGDNLSNQVGGPGALAVAQAPDARNNTAYGVRVLPSLAKGRYNDFFGLEAGYSLNGAGFSESEGKASRNAGFGANTQRFNKTGSLNVSMGRNTLQSNENGTHNTVVGADSAGGIAHMRLSDGQIENQVPQNFWGNSTLGTAALSRTQGSQHVAVGAYTLHNHKAGNGNVGVGFGALRNAGVGAGYNGKVLVDTTANPVYKGLAYSIANEKCTLTMNSGHSLLAGYMVEAQIAGYETQFWYVTEVTPTTVTLNVGMPGFTKRGTLGILNYATNVPAPETTNTVAIGFQAGQLMDNGAQATAVVNSVAIGANSTFIGDNTVSLGNSQQTVHTYSALQTRSDARDKKDVADLDGGLDLVERLRPVSYRLAPRVGPAADERLHTGFIAQEVATAAEGTAFEGVTENGGAFSIAYEELVPVLVKAVQELSAEVATLRKAA